MGSFFSCELKEETITNNDKYYRGVYYFTKEEYNHSFRYLIQFLEEKDIPETDLVDAMTKVRTILENGYLSKETIYEFTDRYDNRDGYTMVDAVLSRMYYHGYGIERDLEKQYR